MSEFILKTYENVIRHEEEAIKMEQRIADEIDQLTKPYAEQLSDKELEGLQDLLFSIALTAEHETFKLGMRYLAKLMLECLA